MDGFLRQSDGEVAGIAAIYTKSSNDDVALIKVGEGITAKTFALASEPLNIGSPRYISSLALAMDKTGEHVLPKDMSPRT